MFKTIKLWTKCFVQSENIKTSLKENLFYYSHLVLFSKYKIIFYVLSYFIIMFLLNGSLSFCMTDESSGTSLPDLAEIDLNLLFEQELNSARELVASLHIENSRLTQSNRELSAALIRYQEQNETLLQEIIGLRSRESRARQMAIELLQENEKLRKATK